MKDKGQKPVKIGLIGLGYWGKNILRNLSELGVLAAAADTNPLILKERASSFPDVRFTGNMYEILEDYGINGVAIATPAATHYELVKLALRYGKDVFVEKPLALDPRQGEELVSIAAETGKILMVGHILQYHPAVVKLKELIKEGALGKVEYIYSNRLNIGKLRTEENILWSFAPHDVSVILSLLDEEPISVSAFGEDYLSEGVYDVTLTMMEFRNKVKAHIFISWLHPFKEQKLIVVGSKSMAVFDDLSEEKLFIYPHKIEWTNGKIPVAKKAEHYPVPVEAKEPLKEEMKHFIECVAARHTPRTDGLEGMRVLRVLNMCQDYLEHVPRHIMVKRESARNGEEGKYFVHPSSYVDEDVEIGEGTRVWHFSHILKGSKIGGNCRIGQNVVIGPNVRIGNGCKIQNNVSVYEGVILEDDVFCGPSCVFTNVFNPRSAVPRMKELRPTIVKRGASIGANATIVCGCILGEYCFVGAGSVVTKDVPPYALVYGNPAKIQGWMCECGVKLEFYKKVAICKECGRKYHLEKINGKTRVDKYESSPGRLESTV